MKKEKGGKKTQLAKAAFEVAHNSNLLVTEGDCLFQKKGR